MLWGNRAVITAERISTGHHHPFHELVVAVAGRGIHPVAEKSYGLLPGDTLLLPGNTFHQARPDRTTPLEICFVCFTNQHLHDLVPAGIGTMFLQAEADKHYFHRPPEDVARENLELAQMLGIEMARQRPFGQDKIGVILAQLLLNHCRATVSSTTPESPHITPIRDICDRISDNPAKPISVDQTAKLAGMSRAAFTRAFRRQTGMSLMEFVNAARIHRAMRLLAESELEISVVAIQSGYDNLGYFYRQFKHNTLYSPRKYRERMRNLMRKHPLPE